jgi:CO dehydrogenase/acetyl-CoA synthase epsilon subunit
MVNTDLIRFLSDSAGAALEKAENAKPENASKLLDEAEENLLLANAVLKRANMKEYVMKGPA